MIAAMMFDAADTLFYNHGLDELLGAWDRHGDPLLRRSHVDSAIHAVGARGLWPPDSAVDSERRAEWTSFYRLAFLEAGHSPSAATVRAAECADRVTDPGSYELFDDVPEVLDALDANGMPMAIVSNFDPLIWPILDRLGIRQRFKSIVTSFEARCYKPDPRIFRIAVDEVDVPAEAVLFVGDSPVTDIAGASAAGLAPVLVDRYDRHPDFAGPRVADLRSLLGAGEGFR